jgi:PAS domain S-box-containing protein
MKGQPATDHDRSIDESSDDNAAEIFARTLVELSPNGVISIDHKGRIVEFNPAAEQMFGYRRDKVMGQAMAELIIPADLRAKHYAGLARYLATGEAHVLGRKLELDAMRSDGTTIPIEIMIVRIPAPGPPIFTSYVRDLTAQRRAASRQKILADAGAILSQSLDYELTLKNLSRAVIPALADWYSVDIRDPESGEVRRIHIDHRDPSKVAMAKLMARRYPSQDEDRGALAVIRTGRTEWQREIPKELLERAAQSSEHLKMLHMLGLRSYLVVPLSTQGQVYGALGLVTAESERLYDEEDVALAEELGRRAGQAVENARLFREIDQQRQQLQDQQIELEAQAAELEETAEALGNTNARLEAGTEALRARTREALAARDEAANANKIKSEFLAAMSHELRTPLNAILGYVDLLSMGIHGTVTPEQSEALVRVKRSSQHLLQLITDILNFAKLEAGRVDYRIRAVPVADVLKTATEIITPQAAAKHIKYGVRDNCPGAAVCADREKLVQILINLLGNAVRHTPEGGEITLSCEQDARDVRITVADSGTGIPSDKLESIFEPFVQVESAYEGERQGTGLGLSISRDLARAMEGDVTVKSELGRGSWFTVRLPVERRRSP